MGEHLSSLVLDELAAQLSPPAPDAARAHVESCPQCRAGLEQRRALQDRLRTDLRFERAFRDLTSSPDRARAQRPPVPRRGRLALLAIPAALAAGLAVLVVKGLPAAGDADPLLSDRVKGRFTLQVRKTRGDPGPGYRVGDRVRLEVGCAGRPYVMVVAVPDTGPPETVWPPGAEQSGLCPRGARAELQPELEVTPGSLTLVAVFSEEKVPAQTLRQAFAGGVRPLEQADTATLRVEVQ